MRGEPKERVEAVFGADGLCLVCGDARGKCRGSHVIAEIVTCGYRMTAGCNYPQTAGLRPFQCATCASGTLQNRLAAANVINVDARGVIRLGKGYADE
jgi:hypothetical protein